VSVGTSWVKLNGTVGKTGGLLANGSADPNYKAWTDTSLGASSKFRVYITSSGGVNLRFAQVMIARMQTGSLIVNGAITATNILAGSITADRLVANSITAAQIQAGAIGATEINAGAIRTYQLAVGNFDNLVQDGGFELYNSSTSRTWYNPNNSPLISVDGWSQTGTSPRSGTYCMQRTYTGNATVVLGQNLQIPVSTGDNYAVEVYVKSVSANGSAGLRVSFRDGADAQMSVSDATLTAAGASAWTKASIVATVPSGCSSIRIQLLASSHTTGTWYWDDAYVRRQTGGTIIELLLLPNLR
jgi:hypothetical protein